MKGEYRKILAFALTFLMVLSVLAGCSWMHSDQDSSITLWVITEQSCSDGMNLQAQMIAERMEESYENLTIQLDILPTDAQEREILLKQLRAQIMAGKGPDVYLLPTGSQLKSDYGYSTLLRKSRYIQITPLFSDVAQAMRNGIFADIQALYDDDSELGTESLKTEIVNAGTLDGARYVLPLRFTIPVLVAASEDLPEFGLAPELLNSSITTLVDEALAWETPAMAVGLRLPNDLSLLPRLYDYENSKMLLTAEEIADYLRQYQAWAAVSTEATQTLLQEWENQSLARDLTILPGMTPEEAISILGRRDFEIEGFSTLTYYLCDDLYWRNAGLPLFTSCLSVALETAVIAKNAKFDAVISPLRTTDGSVTASITYFGAVGSSCKRPELAYEFLRQFLMEEFQWDLYRPRVSKAARLSEVQSPGMIEDSWSVRTAGSVPYLWSSLKYQHIGVYSSSLIGSDEISTRVQHIDMTDDDFPALTWEIDEVRFPVILAEEESIEYALSQLNEEDGTPTDVDIDKLAQQVYQNLWYHLYEG